MRIAIVSESTANERAIHALVEGLLGSAAEIVARARPRPGGWTTRLDKVAPDFLHFHYRTDAEAMIVVFDSDESPVHIDTHDAPNGRVAGCRVCEVLAIIDRIRANAGPRPNGLAALRVGVGLAVPAIEAWLRCGRDVHVTEPAYVRELRDGRRLVDARRQLKRDVYGNDRPGEALETRVAVEQARRLAADLAVLERNFPGFALLAREVRNWRNSAG